ncbi:MAG: hypothetical protein K8963_04655 [Proteobacteria bacterium]|nr:hypothetical protein [Pseudomonadota bacterium]
MIGSNEAGKTTLLDIPRLVADCLGQENINHAFVEGQQGRSARCMTVSELVHQANGNEFFIALEAALPKEVVKSLIPGRPTAKGKEAFWPTTIRYELRLEIAQKTQLQVKNEYLFVFAQKNKPAGEGARMLGTKPHQDWRFVISRESNDKAHIRAEAQKGARAQALKVDATTLALRHIPAKSKKDYPAADWLSNLLTKNFLFYQPDTKSLKTPSPLGSPAKPIASAANLAHLALVL